MEDEEDKRYIASIVERHTITNNTFIFSHLCTQIGYIEGDDKIFTDDQGQIYASITDADALLSTEKRFYANEMELDIAFKTMKVENDDVQVMMQTYDYNNEGYIHYVYIPNEVVLQSNSDNPKNIYYFCADENNMPSNILNYLALNTSINKETKKYWFDMINKIKDNKLGKKELISLKENLDKGKKIHATLESLIDQNINTSNIKKQNLPNIDDRVESKEHLKSTLQIPRQSIDEIYNQVIKTVVAQDEPARRLIVEIIRTLINKTNKTAILLTGSSGVGKTLLMEEIAKSINRPLLIVDTTQLTIPGYVGKNIEDYLYDLYKKCNNDIKETEKAIVYFDEIDKKGSKSKDDISGQGVLNQLLKFIDGTVYSVRFKPEIQSTINIDTSKMLVIAGGAFSDVYKAKNSNPIGFNPTYDKKNYNPTLDDFLEKGMMTREIMCRFPIIVRLNDLSIEDMLRILNESEISPIKIQQEIFKQLDINLRFTEQAKYSIAKQAFSEKRGARGLNGIVLNSTSKCFDYAYSNYKKIEEIVITEQTIEDNNNYMVKEKDENKVKQKRK